MRAATKNRMQPRPAETADIEDVGIVISALVAHARHDGQRDKRASRDDGATDLDVFRCDPGGRGYARLEAHRLLDRSRNQPGAAAPCHPLLVVLQLESYQHHYCDAARF